MENSILSLRTRCLSRSSSLPLFLSFVAVGTEERDLADKVSLAVIAACGCGVKEGQVCRYFLFSELSVVIVHSNSGRGQLHAGRQLSELC